MNDTPDPLTMPPLETLHERHFGLTPSVCASFAEAAGVCLARHHHPPTDFEIRRTHQVVTAAVRRLDWSRPTARAESAWRNRDDATRDGAYSLALSSAECELGLFAVSRASTRTGADYFLGPSMGTESDHLEEAFRLEVAGDDHGGLSSLSNRLKRKKDQLTRGESDKPALACVVGFAIRTVLLEAVEGNHGQ